MLKNVIQAQLAVFYLIFNLFAFLIFPIEQGQAGIGDRFVFMPTRQDFFQCEKAKALKAETIHEMLPARDPLRLYVIRNEQALGWFIHFHGNGESACDNLVFADKMLDLPLNFVFVEYPGFAKDPVSPTEQRILPNALAAFDFIQGQNTEGLPLFLFGESLGSAVATFVSSKREVDRLVLQAPFSDMLKVAANLVPLVPVHLFVDSRFVASEWAREVRAPVMIIHGEKDWVIPLRMGQEQAQNFTQTHVEFVTLLNAGHSDIIHFDKFWESIKGAIGF